MSYNSLTCLSFELSNPFLVSFKSKYWVETEAYFKPKGKKVHQKIQLNKNINSLIKDVIKYVQ